MMFPLTNPSSTLLPNSPGGHKLWVVVFFQEMPLFALSVCHWVTGLAMPKLLKRLSAVCKCWHKPSVNKFLNSACRRAALGKECAICHSFHHRQTASTARFPLCSYTASWRSATDAVCGHCEFSLSKSVSSLSPHTSGSSHPHGACCLHSVVIARTAWL